MKFLYDFFPLLLFFIAFKVYDIYVATATAMVASFIQVGWYWIRHRRFETMHLVGLGAITVFGGLTLILQDERFIKWKPTIVYWILGALFVGSQFFGKKTILERLLSKQISLPAKIWARQNLSWGLFFMVLGIVNLYFAFFYGLDLDQDTRREIWVNVKFFGLLGLTLIFIVIQALGMAKYVDQQAEKEET